MGVIRMDEDQDQEQSFIISGWPADGEDDDLYVAARRTLDVYQILQLRMLENIAANLDTLRSVMTDISIRLQDHLSPEAQPPAR
jgi:hypothetical protein